MFYAGALCWHVAPRSAIATAAFSPDCGGVPHLSPASDKQHFVIKVSSGFLRFDLVFSYSSFIHELSKY
jgi:hypothetical protein